MTSILESIIKRLAWAIVVLLGLSFIIFIISHVVPGDVARLALGPRAAESVVERYREEHHLNDPLPQQYAHWLGNVVKGNFGTSIITRRPVVDDIRDFAPATIELVLWAGLPPMIISLLLGSLGAMYKNRWPDYLIRVLGYFSVATPTFVFAVFFLLFFGYWSNILPSIGGRLSLGFTVPKVTGLMIPDALIAGDFAAAWDAFLHILFPAASLALGNIMQEARITRSNMLDNASKDYITMITSQGVPGGLINRKFLLKPSMISTVSVMGLDFAALFGNAFLVETIFNWPGLSRYAMTAMMQKDINAICAVVMILGVVFITMNILVDIVVLILDPRVRQKRTS